MIISTCGFGNTGASAVLDFLRGYSTLSIQDKIEFQLVHMPDGLVDLKNILVYSGDRVGSNAAIQRFYNLSKSMLAFRLGSAGCDFQKYTSDFISDLNPVFWNGYSNYDPYDISAINHSGLTGKIQRLSRGLLRKINPNFHNKFKNRYFLMTDEKSFDEAAKIYINKIFTSLNVNQDEDVVMDMLFSGVTPNAGMEFFEDPKAIVVYRDPVDLFIRANTHQGTNGFFPCSDVRQFVRYYRMLMDKTVIKNNVLTVQYEDLIYNYYPTTQKIMDFIGRTERPENEFKFFNPDISVKYTRADLTYPGHDEEIECIKANLPEFLYSFPENYTPVADQAR